MATGNPGMKTPYGQGYADGLEGCIYDNPYDQLGEEVEAEDYLRGFEVAYNKFFVTIMNSPRTKEK